ncbi:PoNe immunity protein domain-containing protein [Neisseria sp. HMSC074B07]|uniref:PoNe immunity protein domain-containing protein n=1 Tax=Neisseria sp. HMSC074B07 TaxID=1715205 RepID=UPI001FF028FD|nr:PoNe immunity protein domain-containing protein [Neisseria sp. HMSC074B07]
MLDMIVSTLEISTKFWQQNKAELNEIGYYTSPMPWFYVEYYLKTLHLIALCYLLQREDLLPRLLEVILANAEGDLEPDSTIEDFLDYHFKNRPDPDYVQMGKHAILFGEAMRGETKEEQLEELNAYLKDWYRKMVGMNDLEYQSHLDPEQNGYCGYWAFEAAAIAYLDDLDDTELRQSPYYPKDMVDWAREQKRKREDKGKTD